MDDVDIAFVDLLLSQLPYNGGKQVLDQPTGLAVVERARNRFPFAHLVLYSTAFDSEGTEITAEYRRKAIKAGASDVQSRNWLDGLVEESAREYVETALKASFDQQRAATPIEWGSDIRTQALRERPGEGVVLKALTRAIAEGVSHNVTSLGGGRSGAIMAGVLSKRVGATTLRNVLKFDRREFALSRELLGKPRVGSPEESTSVAPATEVYGPLAGWYVVRMREVEHALRLQQFLLTVDEGDRRTRVAQAVAEACLFRPARVWSPIASGLQERDYRLTFAFGSEVLDSLDELHEVVAHLWTGGDEQIASVRRFLVFAVTRGGWSLLRDSRGLAFLHGDMHTRNIILDGMDRPYVLDFASARAYPRCTDIAAMHVDLIATVLDCQEGNQHIAARATAAWEIVWSMFPFAQRDEPGSSHQGFQKLVNDMVFAAVVALGDVSDTEYENAMLFQCLRYMRMSYLPLVRRAILMRIAASLVERLRLDTAG